MGLFVIAAYLVTDRATPESGGDALHAAGCSGFGAWVRVGLLSRESVFCALYELDSRVWLQIRGEKYCLSANAQRLHHLTAPFARRFVLTNLSGTNVVDLRYWWFLGVRDALEGRADGAPPDRARSHRADHTGEWPLCSRSRRGARRVWRRCLDRDATPCARGPALMLSLPPTVRVFVAVAYSDVIRAIARASAD